MKYFYLHDKTDIWKVSTTDNSFTFIEMPFDFVVRNMFSNTAGDLLWIVSSNGMYLWNSTDEKWSEDPQCSIYQNCTRGVLYRSSVLSKDEKHFYVLGGPTEPTPELFLMTYDAVNLTLYDMQLIINLPDTLNVFDRNFRLGLTPNQKYLIASGQGIDEMGLSIYDVSGDPRHPQLISQYPQATLGE